MGLLGGGSPFDADVEKATSENSESEDWAKIMDICDKVGTSPANAKECLRSIVKRLRNPDPHIVVQAITLLDACVNNCGRSFHLEIASREFETEYRRLLAKYQGAVAQKFKGLLKKWCDGEFKSDPQLNLIPSLMAKLKSEGFDFNDVSDMPARKKEHKGQSSSAAIVAMMQKEQDDIDKAIELSLQQAKQTSPRNAAAAASLYPTVSQLAAPAQEAVKVRALYDFEAAEDNELTFLAGEIIHVSDSSDKNWWKGYNQRGEGLFPANFVTSDLSVETQKSNDRKSVQFNDSVDVKSIEPNPEEPVEIDEAKVDRLISLLHEANPEDSSTDTQEMLYLESEVNRMGPLIDMELEKIDRKHAHLTQLSKDLVDALNLYHTLMREPAHLKQPQGAYPPQMPQMPHMMYNGASAYGSMPPFYAPSSVPGGMMGAPASLPPSHMAHMMPPQMQQQHPMGMPHMAPPGAPPPTPQMPGAGPSFGPVPQTSGAPVGIYQPPPGHSHSFVM